MSTEPTSKDLHALFPTPVQVLRGLIDPETAAALCAVLQQRTPVGNNRSPSLSHTSLWEPGQDKRIDRVAQSLLPRISEFGALLLGERRPWSIKEMWGNVMEHGGLQSLHNHANCMISGVVYLTPTEDATQTVFIKAMGGLDYKLVNDNDRTAPTAFNAQRWRAPDANPGDAVLFPSYLLHEVPQNHGQTRMTLAFNAIPDRIDSWGYGLSFGA